MNEKQIRDQLKGWILKHTKQSNVVDIGDDTPILEQGILSSLDIVEFVLYMENLKGEEIDADEIEPDVFTSIDTLYDAFFRESVSAA